MFDFDPRDYDSRDGDRQVSGVEHDSAPEVWGARA